MDENETIRALFIQFVKMSLQMQTLRLLLAERGIVPHGDFERKYAELEKEAEDVLADLSERAENAKLVKRLQEYTGTKQ